MPYEPISNFILRGKDFDTWNTKKKLVESSQLNISCKAGSVWWCSLGLNIGKEDDGKNENFERPVLIVKTLSRDTCLCIPLTSSGNSHPLRIVLPSISQDTRALISQVKTISIKRLLREITMITLEELQTVKKSLHDLIR